MSEERTRRQALFVLGACMTSVVLGGCKEHSYANLTCVDTTGLAPEDLAARTQVGYVEHSREAGKACKSCQQYIRAKSDAECGSCKVMKGPVHPLGSCNVFAKQS